MKSKEERRLKIPDDIKKIARYNKRGLIKLLFNLPYSDRILGYMITRRAQEKKLISDKKAVVRGKTLKLWAETKSFKEHVPNEWACIVSVDLILDEVEKIDLSNDDLYWTIVYYASPSDDENVIMQSKSYVDQILKVK